MTWIRQLGAATLAVALAANSAEAGIRITEWMYSGSGGEFVELTNTSDAPSDMTGWSYDDDSRTAGGFDLSGFGVVQPGESVLFVEEMELSGVSFRDAWSLPAEVKILGPYTNNLGRSDEINIYDGMGTRVDRLTYGDNRNPLDPLDFVPTAGSIRTQDASGTPMTRAVLGKNSVFKWELSAENDAYESYASLWGDIGNPGTFTAPVPEPSSLLIVLCGLAILALRCRK